MNFAAGDQIPFYQTPKTGSAPTLSLKDASNGYYLDFDDNQWKNAAWTTKTVTMTDATNQWKYVWDTTGLDGDNPTAVLAEFTVGTQVFTDEFTINYTRSLKSIMRKMLAMQFVGGVTLETPGGGAGLICNRTDGSQPILAGTMKLYAADWYIGADGSLEMVNDTLLATVDDAAVTTWETFSGATGDVVYLIFSADQPTQANLADLWVDFPAAFGPSLDGGPVRWRIDSVTPAAHKILLKHDGSTVLFKTDRVVKPHISLVRDQSVSFEPRPGSIADAINDIFASTGVLEDYTDGSMVIDGSVTLAQLRTALTASLLGLSDGGNSATTNVYRQDGTTPAITLTVNNVGDRSEVVSNLG